MNPQGQRQLIIVLTAVLLAVLAAGISIIVFLPGEEPAPLSEETPVPLTPTTPSQPTTDTFPTGVLNRNSYRSLNASLIERGLLPVPPASNAGKANPFL